MSVAIPLADRSEMRTAGEMAPLGSSDSGEQDLKWRSMSGKEAAARRAFQRLVPVTALTFGCLSGKSPKDPVRLVAQERAGIPGQEAWTKRL
jgi:hypothetical protein